MKLTYIVVAKDKKENTLMIGPYRSFRKAENDAKSWDGHVEPLTKPDDAVRLCP